LLEPKVLLAAHVPPAWSEVEKAREAVRACPELAEGGDELRDALSMVAAELLENALKYGDGEPIELFVHRRGEEMEVAVAHPLADEGRARSLVEQLSWIAAQPSPADAYAEALRSTQPGRGGLGLVRIAYEGGCSLSAACDGPRLTVRATRSLWRPPLGL
jgi:hypothetical protein